MTEQTHIAIGGFEFTVEEIDGCRLIEATYPATIDVSTLSHTIAQYYDLWDENVPSVSLANLSRLESLSEETRQVLKSVIQRTVLQPSFVAAAWYTDENRTIYDEIMRVRREAGRPTDDVFETRDEAIAFLRSAITAWYGARSANGAGVE